MKVDRAELLATLESVAPGLAEAKSAVQQGNRFVFKGGRVYTFNDEVGISHPVKLDIEGAVVAKEMYSLLRRHRTKEVDIVIDGHELKIAVKNSKAGISLDATEGIFDEEIALPKKWFDLPPDFMPAIQLARAVASKDTSALLLTLVSVDGDTCWATDNIQIIGAAMGGTVPTSFILPASAISDLAGHNPTGHGLTEGWVHFRNADKVTFSVRAAEADFPNLEKFITPDGATVEIAPGWEGALDRVSVFAKEAASGMVRVTGVKGGVVFSTRNDSGWIKERHKAVCPKGVAFALHVDILIAALQKSGKFRVTDTTLTIEAECFRYAVCLLADGEDTGEE